MAEFTILRTEVCYVNGGQKEILNIPIDVPDRIFVSAEDVSRYFADIVKEHEAIVEKLYKNKPLKPTVKIYSAVRGTEFYSEPKKKKGK